MRYGTSASGKENAIVFWCGHCGDREPEKPWPLTEARANEPCPNCHGAGYRRFVMFEKGVEDEAAEAIMRGLIE